ncbi:porin [Burkholderia sp. Tr-20390]|uniref:porin n=1 Tax=Burkholderia sp. Tr-20390 TaxID=2703904 RepID=UPI001F120D01|nr:porin [Burkholderia sp. Tr-20390]
MRFGAAITVLLSCAVLMDSASAQSSVTMFGLLDAGVTYVSNEGGHSNFKFDDGIYNPNFWGLQGKEDLGGGYYASFRLLNQFQLSNGAVIPGQSFFGQEAYVALASDKYGEFRLGEQYDFMHELLLPTGADGALYGGGFYNFRNGPFNALQIPNNATGAISWDRLNGVPVDNAVKYLSPSIAGLRLGAMYGFGNVAGSTAESNAYSFDLLYRAGGFSGGAAYTSQRYAGGADGPPQIRIVNWGVGARYSFESFGINALLTTVKNQLSGASAYSAQVGGSWQSTPFWLLSANYMYMKGNETLTNNHAHQITGAASYFLSKRTAVYAEAAYQRTNSGAFAQFNGVYVPSSSPSQAIGRVGVRTSF